jgi:hypothetical protein
MNWKKLLTGLWRFVFVAGLITSGLLGSEITKLLIGKR